MVKTYMNDQFKQARQMFPNIPEEVFTLWFDGRIESNGWPPTAPIWQHTLRYRSPEYWATLKWKTQEIKLEFEKFTEPAKGIITGLIEAVFLKTPNVYSAPEFDSNSKISKIISYIKENNVLPNPLIFLLEGNFYEIVDGSHRLATFFAMRQNRNLEHLLSETQLAWVGYIP